MEFQKIKGFFKQNLIFYLIGFVIIFGIKLFYSRAGLEELHWILAPTVWWVRILGRITFEYETGIGYINHYFRFIVAPSCSGVQFLMIAAATLIFSFVHRANTFKMGFCWIGISLLLSYLSTIAVNSLRIILAVYLPIYLPKEVFSNSFFTPLRLHTIIGIAVYFTSLFFLYRGGHRLCCKMVHKQGRDMNNEAASFLKRSMTHTRLNYLPPVFWYFFLILGVPFLNRAYKNNRGNFLEYASLLTLVCLIIILLFSFTAALRLYWIKRRTNRQNLLCKKRQDGSMEQGQKGG